MHDHASRITHAFRNLDREERLGSALLVAERLHRTQRRKGTDIPYVSHLLTVAATVMEHGGTETEIIAALLHDAAEDQGGEPVLVEIEHAFGKAVADIVRACSDTLVEPKPPWRERKAQHIAHLSSESTSVLRVTAADKLHNLRSMLRDHYMLGDSIWPRFKADPPSIIWYHREVTDIVRRGGLTDMAAELDRVLDELEGRIRGEG